MCGWAFEALVLKFLSTNETTAFVRAAELCTEVFLAFAIEITFLMSIALLEGH
jgi:hypothetical protein